jgi:3-hydroxymyristoyl/3-hydroxydecanoyl-(acyl carrier protein) dehydratase
MRVAVGNSIESSALKTANFATSPFLPSCETISEFFQRSGFYTGKLKLNEYSRRHAAIATP